MNSANSEISNAIREAQSDRTTVLRYVCLVCKEYLSDWDVESGRAICLECKHKYWPEYEPFQRDNMDMFCPLLAFWRRSMR